MTMDLLFMLRVPLFPVQCRIVLTNAICMTELEARTITKSHTALRSRPPSYFL
jgi:hypothetical protein